MAINQRPDTPLAATPEPDINPNGPIKRTTSTNPSEGTTTYRQSWNTSSQSKSSTPAKAKSAPTKPVSAPMKPVSAPAKTATKTNTPNSREFTTFKSPTAAGPTKDMSIKTPAIKSRESFVPKARTEIIASNKVKDYNKNKSGGEGFEEYRKRIQENANKVSEKNKAKSSSSGSLSSDKQRSGSCTTCY